MILRAPYNYDVDAASAEAALRCEDETRTQQHFAEECDINTIVRRFGLTGQLPTDVRQPVYGDYTGITDFQGAMQAVALARESFEQMPADVRARFQNDPAQFVEFCLDDKNADEARKLGLRKPLEAPQPVVEAPTAPVVAPAKGA